MHRFGGRVSDDATPGNKEIPNLFGSLLSCEISSVRRLRKDRQRCLLPAPGEINAR